MHVDVGINGGQSFRSASYSVANHTKDGFVENQWASGVTGTGILVHGVVQISGAHHLLLEDVDFLLTDIPGQ